MAKIDPVTADQVRHILLLCRSRGLDAVTVLDRAGFLNHEAQRREESAILFDMLVQELSAGPTSRALNVRTFHTPMDMKWAIITFLKEVAAQWKKEATSSRG